MAEQEPPTEPLDGLPEPEATSGERQTLPLRRRWIASAPVPAPSQRARRRLFRLRPPTETGEDDTLRENTLDMPAVELAALLREPAPLPAAPAPPAPAVPLPALPPPAEPVAPPGWAAAPQPWTTPAGWAPPRGWKPPARGRPPRGWKPPAGWTPPASWTPPARWKPPRGWVPPGWVRRRRRRWPWVVLVVGLLTVGCCCGCPALVAKPFLDEYPVNVSLPAQAAGLVRVDDEASRRLTADLKRRVRSEYLLADDVFAGVYTRPEKGGEDVTLLGAARLILDPDKDLKSALGKLSRVSVTGARALDAGPLGGTLRCGQAVNGGGVVCGWADHGSIGVAVFTGRSTEESAQLLRGLRAAVVTRS
jgi:hypothetical protein